MTPNPQRGLKSAFEERREVKSNFSDYVLKPPLGVGGHS
jgi:hypothetical protein